jgi:hypothetical protein
VVEVRLNRGINLVAPRVIVVVGSVQQVQSLAQQLLMRVVVPAQMILEDGAAEEVATAQQLMAHRTLVVEEDVGMEGIALQEMVDQALLLFPMRRTAAMESQHLLPEVQLQSREAEEFILSLQVEHLQFHRHLRFQPSLLVVEAVVVITLVVEAAQVDILKKPRILLRLDRIRLSLVEAAQVLHLQEEDQTEQQAHSTQCSLSAVVEVPEVLILRVVMAVQEADQGEVGVAELQELE